jgi:hypothetical protein
VSAVVAQNHGSKVIPDGAYQFIGTDDPHIIVVRDYQGVQTLGFLTQNNGGGAPKYFPDLQEAQSFEHQGDRACTTSKVAVEALIVTAILALVGAAAVASNGPIRSLRIAQH